MWFWSLFTSRAEVTSTESDDRADADVQPNDHTDAQGPKSPTDLKPKGRTNPQRTGRVATQLKYHADTPKPKDHTAAEAKAKDLTNTKATNPSRIGANVIPPDVKPVTVGKYIKDRIITPYRVDRFEHYLRKHRLLDKHPSLLQNLRTGFPIGNFQKLDKTLTPPNSRSAAQHEEFIRSYIQEERSKGRVNGPYTATTVSRLLGGHFVTSPLSVKEKAGKPGKYRLIQNFSFKHDTGFAVNDCIDPNEYPTRWGTTAMVAEIVSVTLCSAFSSRDVSSRCLRLSGVSDLSELSRTCEHESVLEITDRRSTMLQHDAEPCTDDTKF